MKSIFLSIFLSIFIGSIFAQNYDVRFNRSSANCQTREVCYNVQIRPNGPSPFTLAGQNWRIFWDASKASFISGSSTLPTPLYTPYTQVQLVQNVNAGATNGLLDFEDNLSFLNFFMDLNNTEVGGILLTAGQWTTVANLCFSASQEVIDNPFACIELVFARETLTAPYATAYVQVSRWVSSGVTTNSVGVLYDDLNSLDGDQACFDITCSTSGITIADITVNESDGIATLQVCIPTSTSQPVTVTVNTSNSTAVAPHDYISLTDFLVTITTGQTCAPVNIEIINDTVFENSEFFNVVLSNPSSNAFILDDTATVTILDNDNECPAQAPRIIGN